MKALTDTANELKNHLTEDLKLVKTLGDEIRLDIHLAGMDAKKRWEELQPQIEEAERIGSQVTKTARQAVTELLGDLVELRQSVRRPAAQR